jgi:hypothetical protein
MDIINIPHSLTHSWSWALLEKLSIGSYSRSSQHFMEPGGSLPCSQEPSTGPYPEPDQSNPYHPTLSLINIPANFKRNAFICVLIITNAKYETATRPISNKLQAAETSSPWYDAWVLCATQLHNYQLNVPANLTKRNIWRKADDVISSSSNFLCSIASPQSLQQACGNVKSIGAQKRDKGSNQAIEFESSMKTRPRRL